MGKTRKNIKQKRNKLQRTFYLPKKTSKLGVYNQFYADLEDCETNLTRVKRNDVKLTDQDDIENRLAIPVRHALSRQNKHLTQTLFKPKLNITENALPDKEWMANTLSKLYFFIIH